LGWHLPREQEVWRFLTRAKELREVLVEEYYPFAQKVVKQFCNRRRIPYDEVAGSEHDGLMRAMRNYDAESGVPFEAFLLFHLRGATLDFARTNERRPCRHGERPKFELGPLGDIGEAELGHKPDQQRIEVQELLLRVLKKVTTPLRRNILVRCCIIGLPSVEAAHLMGISNDTVEAELVAVMQEAADIVKELGISTASFENANPSMYKLRRRAAIGLLTDGELVKLGAEQLMSSERKKEMPDPDARPLVGTCSNCGHDVIGPKGIHGPIPVTCECGSLVEVV